MIAFERWIAEAYRRPVAWLALWRILYAAAQLVGWHTPPVVPLGALGDLFFFPPLGPFEMLPGYPPVRAIRLVELARDVSLLALLVGYRTGAAGWTAGLTQMFLAGLRYSTGKIDHELLIFLVPIVMASSPWGAALSVDAGRPARRPPADSGPPLAWLALAIGVTYFTAGFAKALTGWLDPSGSATRGYLVLYLRQYPWGGTAVNALLAESVPAWVWKAMDYATVLFETSVLVTIVRPAWFRTALTAALGFHLGVVALLNIDFTRLIVCYAPFLFAPRGDRLAQIDRTLTRVLAWPGRAWPLVLGVVGALYWQYGQRRGYPALADEWPAPRPLSLAIALAVVALAYLTWRDWLRPRASRARAAARAEIVRPAPRSTTAATTASRRQLAVFLAVAVALPVQLACVVWASEPYPAPTGPLFMGNPEIARRARVFRQEIVVVQGEERRPSDAPTLLGVPEPYATNIATFRFPLVPVPSVGETGASVGWYERLATQGHKFAATGRHRLSRDLVDAERRYLAGRFPDAAAVEVTWWRESVGVEAGRLVVDRAPLTRYRLPLR